MEQNSNSFKAKLITIILCVVLFGGVGAYLLSAKFTAAKFENAIKAQNENMKNVYSTGQNSLQMLTSTVKNYTKSDLEKVKVLIGKYDGKPQMLMMAVKDNSQGLSPQLHRDLMDSIEKYSAKWEVTQKSKISVTQEYRTFLDASIKGSIASGIFAYPTKQVQDMMDQIIMSSDTKTTFETGIDNAKDLFQDKK